MAIKDIFNSVILATCGACSSSHPCDKSLKDTLLANGLPESELESVKDLSGRWSGNGGFQYSPLYNKIQELMKKYHQ